jgi:hypothetical protein
MKITTKIMAAGLGACCCLAAGEARNLLAQPAPQAISGTDKVLMKHAAEANCYSLMVQEIKGLKVSEDMTVADAVTQDFEQTGESSGFVRGAVLKDPVFIDDVCVVEGQITLDQVVENLNHSIETVSDKLKQEILAIKRFNTKRVVTVRGLGTVPAPQTPDEPNAPSRDVGEAQTLRSLSGPGQYKVMAMQAARLDALAKLAANLKGVRVSSEITVRNCAASSWEEADTTAIVRGARVVRYAALAPDLVECWVEITLDTVVENLKRDSTLFPNGNEVTVEKVRRFNKKMTVPATGLGAVVKPSSSTSDAIPGSVR